MSAWDATSDVAHALTRLMVDGQVPGSAHIGRVAQIVLDVLFAQNTPVADRCRGAIAATLSLVVDTQATSLAVRAVQALRSNPCVPVAKILAAPDDATAGVLTRALDRFAVDGQWDAVHETLTTVGALFSNYALPQALLHAGIRALQNHAGHCTRGHTDVVCRHLTMLAHKDVNGEYLGDLCEAWVHAVHRMSQRAGAPQAADLHALDTAVLAMYRGPNGPNGASGPNGPSGPRNERRVAVVRALAEANGLSPLKALLQRHGHACAANSFLVCTFWAMAALLDDAQFAELVTERESFFQKLQGVTGWSQIVPEPCNLVATHARIVRLGVEWSALSARAAAALHDATARAGKAEEEVARLNAALRDMRTLLDARASSVSTCTTAPVAPVTPAGVPVAPFTPASVPVAPVVSAGAPETETQLLQRSVFHVCTQPSTTRYWITRD
jgi:hypothetical protein